MLRRDGYPIVPLSDAEREARDPLVRRQKELQQQREEEGRRQAHKAREGEEKQRAASTSWYAALDGRIHEHLQNWLWNAIDERIREHFESHDRMYNGVVGEVIGVSRAKLGKHFEAEISKLREEFRVGIGRLPIAKTWNSDEVCYRGDVVIRDGSVFQALKDTGKPPAADHPDWILLARAGHDGCDGLSANVCGAFDPGKKYFRLDIVEFHGASFIARCDDPGACPGDDDTGWQLLSRAGPRGDTGPVGPRGRKGERGERGETLTIVAWTLDRKRYCAVPTLSNGTQGAVLELRGLFEQFHEEVAL